MWADLQHEKTSIDFLRQPSEKYDIIDVRENTAFKGLHRNSLQQKLSKEGRETKTIFKN